MSKCKYRWKLAFQEFDNDENSKVAVLHGTGGNFCAGFDLSELSSDPNITTKLQEDVGPMVSNVICNLHFS